LSLQTYHSEVSGFTHGCPSFVPQRPRLPLCFVDEDNILPHTDTLEGKPPSFFPIPVDGGGQPLPSQRVQSVSRVQTNNSCERAMLEGQNMGSLAVNSYGILHTPPPPRLTPSAPSFSCGRSDSPPSFFSGCFGVGILPTPHFSTRLPPNSCHRHRQSGSSTRRSGPPQKASSTPISCATSSTLGTHPLSFSPLPSPPLPPPTPQQPPVLASLPIDSPLLPSLPSLLASPHSLLLYLRQVTQFIVPCRYEFRVFDCLCRGTFVVIFVLAVDFHDIPNSNSGDVTDLFVHSRGACGLDLGDAAHCCVGSKEARYGQCSFLVYQHVLGMLGSAGAL